jgi:hypothetical protein
METAVAACLVYSSNLAQIVLMLAMKIWAPSQQGINLVFI